MWFESCLQHNFWILLEKKIVLLNIWNFSLQFSTTFKKKVFRHCGIVFFFSSYHFWVDKWSTFSTYSLQIGKGCWEKAKLTLVEKTCNINFTKFFVFWIFLSENMIWNKIHDINSFHELRNCWYFSSDQNLIIVYFIFIFRIWSPMWAKWLPSFYFHKFFWSSPMYHLCDFWPGSFSQEIPIFSQNVELPELPSILRLQGKNSPALILWW